MRHQLTFFCSCKLVSVPSVCKLHLYIIIFNCSGADTRVCDHSNMNPFMLAVEKGLTHLNVANAMAKMDPSLVTAELESGGAKMDPSLVTAKLESGLTVNDWAQENGHDAFFKVCHFSTSQTYLYHLCHHFLSLSSIIR